jgi:hypothetical protein
VVFIVRDGANRNDAAGEERGSVADRRDLGDGAGGKSGKSDESEHWAG